MPGKGGNGRKFSRHLLRGVRGAEIHTGEKKSGCDGAKGEVGNPHPSQTPLLPDISVERGRLFMELHPSFAKYPPPGLPLKNRRLNLDNKSNFGEHLHARLLIGLWLAQRRHYGCLVW